MSLTNLLRKPYEKLFPGYQQELLRVLAGCSSILDVGCGCGSPVAAMRGKARLVGVDAHAASLELARERGTHDEFHIHNVLGLGELFPPNSFDCVVALGVIEHLEKQEGVALLQAMETISSRRIVLFTPNGFLRQGEYDNNPWQVHKSGWEVKEMRDRGYRVIGLDGWRPLRGELGFVKYWPSFFWIVVSDITQFAVRGHPEKAFQILCVKDKTSAQERFGQR